MRGEGRGEGSLVCRTLVMHVEIEEDNLGPYSHILTPITIGTHAHCAI